MYTLSFQWLEEIFKKLNGYLEGIINAAWQGCACMRMYPEAWSTLVYSMRRHNSIQVDQPWKGPILY